MTVFRLYPEEGRTLFVRVRIHEDLDAMREALRELNRHGYTSTDEWDDVLGCCTEIEVHHIYEHGRSRRDPCIAEVNMAWDHCGTTVLTHELFHATMAWARRTGFDFGRVAADDSVNDDEERIAHVHSNLCADFVERAVAAGVYA